MQGSTPCRSTPSTGQRWLDKQTGHMAPNPTRSSRGRNARRRGASAENEVAKYLRTQGYPDARRYLAGDGRQPGDIDWHPLVLVEVKDVAGSAWPTWQRQAIEEAREGIVPVVVRRTRGVPNVALWPATIHPHLWWETFDSLPDVQLVERCQTCRKWGHRIECPTGGWWAHDDHPADDHDLVPPEWVALTFGDVVRAVQRFDLDARSAV